MKLSLMEDRGKIIHFGLIFFPGLILLGIVVMNLVEVTRGNLLDFPLNMTTETLQIREIVDRVLLGQAAVHKELFPLDNSDIVGSLLIGMGLMIAASGGIGGGGILVPLLIIVFGFKPKYAIPLSNFTILGSSITNIVMNLPKRHPDADRPLIDWDLILVMEPLTMAGAIVGALIGKVVPDWLLVTALVVLLSYISVTTLLKARTQYYIENQIEDAAKSKFQTTAISSDLEMSVRSVRSDISSDISYSAMHSERDEETGTGGRERSSTACRCDELVSLIEEEKKTPLDKIIILALLVAVVVGVNMLKGGEGLSPLGIQCGSMPYWCLTAAILAWIGIISLWVRATLIQRWKLKQRVQYIFITGDIEWNERNTIIYPSLCFFAGFFAGMFGVGGGIVKGPLMLQMGVHPLVAAATTAVMIMFTSVAATTMFIAFGTLTWDYALYLFFIGLFATIIGQFCVGYLVHKYKRYSFITISIGLVVLISAILMGLESVYSISDAKNGDGISKNSVCG